MTERIASVALHLTMIVVLTALVCTVLPKRASAFKKFQRVEWSLK